MPDYESGGRGFESSPARHSPLLELAIFPCGPEFPRYFTRVCQKAGGWLFSKNARNALNWPIFSKAEE